MLQGLVGVNVHQVGAWDAVLRNEDRLLVPFQLGEKRCGLALQCCDEFGSHKSNTIVALWSLQALCGLTAFTLPVRLLLNRRIGALPVLKDEKVIGIITETDMIRALIDLEEAS